MKSILILLSTVTFLFTVQELKAQGNLEFNQVLLIDVAGVALNDVPIAVPAGKVWKIESASTGTTSTSYIWLANASGDYLMMMGGTLGDRNHFPIWLPSGFTGYFSRTGSTANAGAVSIIEFNVIN